MAGRGREALRLREILRKGCERKRVWSRGGATFNWEGYAPPNFLEEKIYMYIEWLEKNLYT